MNACTENRQTVTLGGVCAVLTGVMYVLVAVSFFMLPAAQSPAADGYSDAFFASVESDRLGLEIMYWSLTFSAVFGIAAVATVSDLVRSVHEGWVRWTSTLATIGFGIQIAANVLGRDYVFRTSAGYADLHRTVQAALKVQGNLYDDWVIFGLVGAWLLTVNVLALRGRLLPRVLGGIGLLGGVTYLMVAATKIFAVPVLMTIAVSVGGILVPVWYIWTGVRLLREDDRSASGLAGSH